MEKFRKITIPPRNKTAAELFLRLAELSSKSGRGKQNLADCPRVDGGSDGTLRTQADFSADPPRESPPVYYQVLCCGSTNRPNIRKKPR